MLLSSHLANVSLVSFPSLTGGSNRNNLFENLADKLIEKSEARLHERLIHLKYFVMKYNAKTISSLWRIEIKKILKSRMTFTLPYPSENI